jgi:hypothetical protein
MREKRAMTDDPEMRGSGIKVLIGAATIDAVTPELPRSKASIRGDVITRTALHDKEFGISIPCGLTTVKPRRAT